MLQHVMQCRHDTRFLHLHQQTVAAPAATHTPFPTATPRAILDKQAAKWTPGKFWQLLCEPREFLTPAARALTAIAVATAASRSSSLSSSPEDSARPPNPWLGPASALSDSPADAQRHALDRVLAAWRESFVSPLPSKATWLCLVPATPSSNSAADTKERASCRQLCCGSCNVARAVAGHASPLASGHAGRASCTSCCHAALQIYILSGRPRCADRTRVLEGILASDPREKHMHITCRCTTA